MSDGDPHMPLFHIVTVDAWAAARRDGLYRAESLDEEQFIHCSFAQQVRSTLARHYPGVSGLLIVELDPARIDAPIRVEQSPLSGDAFPHVYGPIPVSAAVRVHSADAWISGPGGPGDAASPGR